MSVLPAILPGISIRGSVGAAGLAALLPTITVRGGEGVATLTALMPSISIEAQSSSAVLEAILPTINASIEEDSIAIGALVAPLATIYASVEKSGAAQLEALLPAISIGVHANIDAYVSLVAILPGISASGSAIIVDEFTVIVVNPDNAAHSEYDNFPFTSFATFNGKHYATGEGGIFSLGGDLDEAAEIPASVMSGNTDLGVSNDKRLLKAHVNAALAGSVDFISETGTDSTVTRQERRIDNTQKDSSIRNSSVRLARTQKGNSFRVGIKNVDGSDFEIFYMDVLPQILASHR